MCVRVCACVCVCVCVKGGAWLCFCDIVLCARFSFAAISLRKRELVALVELYSCFDVCVSLFVVDLVSLSLGDVACAEVVSCNHNNI